MTEQNLRENDFWQSLKVQLRVIEALVMREVLTRYGRENLGFLWLFFEPILFCAAVALSWTLIRDKGAHTELSVPAFALTGYCSVLLWRHAANRCSAAVAPNMNLLFHRNVRVIDLYLSRLILEILSVTTAFLVLTLLFAALGFCELPRYPIYAIQGWLLLIFFSIGLGLVVGCLSAHYEGFARFWQVSIFVFFPLSGAIFMVDWLPTAVRDAVLWVPTVHATELLRHGFYGDAVQTWEQPGYLAFCGLGLLLAGLALVRIHDRRIMPE